MAKKKPLETCPYKIAERMARVGGTNKEIGIVLGISKRTLQERILVDEKLNDAIESGRNEGKDTVRQTAFKMATSGECPAMTIFWLKTQCRWQEKSVIKHEGIREQLSELTETQLLERLMSLRKENEQTEDRIH